MKLFKKSGSKDLVASAETPVGASGTAYSASVRRFDPCATQTLR